MSTFRHRIAHAAVVLSICGPGSGSMAGAPDIDSAYPHTLTLRQGDLVQGSLTTVAPPSSQQASLDLQDDKGRHVRRLIAPDAAQRSFMFVAPWDGEYRLQVTPGEHAVQPAIDIEHPLPISRQHEVPQRLPSQRLQALVDGLAALPPDAKPDTAHRLVEDFWTQIERSGTPLIEPIAQQPNQVLVTFLWRGAQRNARIMASPSGDHDAMRKLPGTDIWYASYPVPDSARLSYRIAPDVPTLPVTAAEQRRAIRATAQRDPLNPRWTTTDGHVPLDIWDGDSVLELPNAPIQPWIAHRPDVPHGDVKKISLTSALLGNTRDVYLYRPAGWQDDPQRQRSDQNLLLVFDGEKYSSTIPTADILDNLMADGMLAPTAAILVGNATAQSRASELPPNPLFARFLAEELMPWAVQQGLAAPADHTVIAGSSYGGLAAAYAAMRAPQWFGNVLSQSGSFWWPGPVAPGGSKEPGWLTREYASSPRLPLKFYLEAGLFEGSGIGDIPPMTRHLRDVMIARGYRVTHAEYASGHDSLHWRGSLACGLIDLVGTRASSRPQTAQAIWRKACPAHP